MVMTKSILYVTHGVLLGVALQALEDLGGYFNPKMGAFIVVRDRFKARKFSKYSVTRISHKKRAPISRRHHYTILR